MIYESVILHFQAEDGLIKNWFALMTDVMIVFIQHVYLEST